MTKKRNRYIHQWLYTFYQSILKLILWIRRVSIASIQEFVNRVSTTLIQFLIFQLLDREKNIQILLLVEIKSHPYLRDRNLLKSKPIKTTLALRVTKWRALISLCKKFK